MSLSLGWVHQGRTLAEMIWPNLNIRNVLEEYEGTINIFTELTEDCVLDKKELGRLRRKYVISGLMLGTSMSS